jgi:hypothetical protein
MVWCHVFFLTYTCGVFAGAASCCADSKFRLIPKYNSFGGSSLLAGEESMTSDKRNHEPRIDAVDFIAVTVPSAVEREEGC